LRIKFIGHASLLIEAGGVTILSDPWWSGPCFGAQWWNHPPPRADFVDKYVGAGAAIGDVLCDDTGKYPVVFIVRVDVLIRSIVVPASIVAACAHEAAPSVRSRSRRERGPAHRCRCVRWNRGQRIVTPRGFLGNPSDFSRSILAASLVHGMIPSQKELTRLLTAWSEGDAQALERLSQAVYNELRVVARHYMRGESSGHTLQTTALVHEAFMRLMDWKTVEWKNRAHFFAVAAQMMRRILVDHARAHNNLKRGGDWKQVDLTEAEFVPGNRPADIIRIDDALQALESLDRRKSQVIELRFFGGLTVEETAEVLRISSDTVLSDWRLAKSWLLRELSRGNPQL
jgi:RNA polymerase sigma factor (TIGR02999 family)